MSRTVRRDDGSWRGIHNESSRTIHLRDPDRPERSLCRNQWSRGGAHTKTSDYWVAEADLDVAYITDDGEVVGKLCGNCRQQVSEHD